MIIVFFFVFCFFFFFKQKTAYEMRISDWSSDVCSSDLLEHARKAAEQDHLTGLPNRRAFEGTLREAAVRARDKGKSLSVAFCDIDHFKQINDVHGHDVGDRILKFVGKLLADI